MKFRAQFIGFLISLFTISPLWSQDTERSLLKEIEKVKKEIQTERELEEQEVERDRVYRERASARKADIANQLRTLKAQTDSIKNQVKTLEESNKKLVGASRYFDAQRQKFAQSLSVLLDSLAAQIQTGFPFEANVHAEILSSTASGLRSGAVTPEEGLTRSWSVISTRLRKSLESELYSGVINHQNVEVSGTYLRYGLVFSFFKSEDGRVMKFYQPNEGTWMDLPEDLEMRRKFKEAFEVMEGKAPPALVELPLWITTKPSTSASAKGGES